MQEPGSLTLLAWVPPVFRIALWLYETLPDFTRVFMSLGVLGRLCKLQGASEAERKDVWTSAFFLCFLYVFAFEECAAILSNVAQCDWRLLTDFHICITSWFFAMSARCRLQTCCRPSLAFWCARLGNIVKICKALSELVFRSLWQGFCCRVC